MGLTWIRVIVPFLTSWCRVQLDGRYLCTIALFLRPVLVIKLSFVPRLNLRAVLLVLDLAIVYLWREYAKLAFY